MFTTKRQVAKIRCSNAMLVISNLTSCATFKTICELMLVKDHSHAGTAARDLLKKVTVTAMRRSKFVKTDHKLNLLILKTQIIRMNRNNCTELGHACQKRKF